VESKAHYPSLDKESRAKESHIGGHFLDAIVVVVSLAVAVATSISTSAAAACRCCCYLWVLWCLCKFFYVRGDNGGVSRLDRLCFGLLRTEFSNCVSRPYRASIARQLHCLLAAARRDSWALMLTAGVPSTRLGYFLGIWGKPQPKSWPCGSMGVGLVLLAWQSNYILWASKLSENSTALWAISISQ